MKEKIIKIVSRTFMGIFGLFVTTVLIYWFNLENKLLYYVVNPFLQKHYDKQNRDRRI